MYKIRFFLIGFVLIFLHESFPITCKGENKNKDRNFENKGPFYKQSSFSGESVTLKNDSVTLTFYKKLKGWGWGELMTSSGKLMAVIDHLGEMLLRDQDIPIQLVADSYKKYKDEDGESLSFNVQSLVVRDILEGTSFGNWMVYPFTEPAIRGEVTITLSPSSPFFKLKYRLTSTGNYYVRYIRGPWLKVGESSFKIEKDDALLPGVDWAVQDEWTSGTDFFKDPWALRVAPHPNKVSIPLMAVSQDGDGIGLAWEPNQAATRWFNYRAQKPQPVFASPNFVDRKNNQLMGLMIPDASVEGHENEVYARIPLELKIGQMINFDAELWLSKGNSVDVMIDWVKRHGLPEPSKPRWDYQETLSRIANAYNTNFWHEGEGFGIIQRPGSKIYPSIPSFLLRYIKENKGTKLAKELQLKIDWSEKQVAGKGKHGERLEQQKSRGEKLLSEQNEDGSFGFNPDDIGKDDFKVATSFIEPMGLKGETALDVTIRPAMQLLEIGKETGDRRFLDAAKKAFDSCLGMQRPEAGDYWETPLHAANLLAAGNAAIGNYLAFQQFGADTYRQKAIYWMRTILAFTHLWETSEVPMLYNTKPVLSSSDWYFANWVRDHVQWEVLSVFADISARNLKWDEIDPEIDWLRFQEGITNAAIRWMNIHSDKNWLPHNLPETYGQYARGDFDYAFPDTHNSVTGNYGGMMIMPEPIAENIYYLLDRKGGE